MSEIFKFSDGIRIETSITLTQDQKNALNKLVEFYHSSSMKTFALMGYAGTGKTTIMKYFLAYFQERYHYSMMPSIHFSSPTHRANTVLSEYIWFPISTMHSLFGLYPNIDLETFDATDLKFSQNNGNQQLLGKDSFLVIDEASMINDQLYDFVDRTIEQLEAKVLFVGDPAQLKPVKQITQTKAFSDVDGQYLLKSVVRTDDMDLVGALWHIRKYNTFPESTIRSLKYVSSEEEFLQLALEKYSSKKFQTDKFYCRVISATNARVRDYSRTIRQAVFREESQEQYCIGDILMAYSNYGRVYQTNAPYIMNSCDYEVLNVSEPMKVKSEKIEMLVHELILRDLFAKKSKKHAERTVRVLSTQNSQYVFDKIGEKFEELRLKAMSFGKRGRTKRIDAIRKGCWARFYTFCDSVCSPIDIYYDGIVKMRKLFDYGYAHTIHKCLSEESYVFTQNGIVQLKNIPNKYNVSVGSNGEYRSLLSKINCGLRSECILTTKCGYRIKASSDHKIIDDSLSFRKLGDFSIGDFIPIYRNNIIPNDIDNSSRDESYLLGYIVGDGSYNIRKKSRSRIDITIGYQDTDVLDILREICLKCHAIPNVYMRKNAWQFVIENKAFRERCLEKGLLYVCRENKSVPESIFEGGFQVISSFLRGLFDSDGSVNSNGRITFVTISEKLVYDVQILLLRFGIISYIKKYESAYYLYITGEDTDIFRKYISFGLERKRYILYSYVHSDKTNKDYIPYKNEVLSSPNISLTKKQRFEIERRVHLNYKILNDIDVSGDELLSNVKANRYYFDTVISVKNTGKLVQMYDLEIEDIHQYIADGFIVHNSQGTTYSHIFVDDASIEKSFYDDKEIQGQLRYVAASRASKSVSVFRTQHIGIKE